VIFVEESLAYRWYLEDILKLIRVELRGRGQMQDTSTHHGLHISDGGRLGHRQPGALSSTSALADTLRLPQTRWWSLSSLDRLMLAIFPAMLVWRSSLLAVCGVTQ